MLSYFEVVEELLTKDKLIDKEIALRFETSIKFSQDQILTKIKTLPLRSGIDICKGELEKKLVDVFLNTCSKEHQQQYTLTILKLLSEQADVLNTDDTDMIQYSLAAIRNSVEKDNTIVTVIFSDSASVTLMMKILMDILKVHKKMLNLIQYLVDILGVYFEDTQRQVNDEQRTLLQRYHQVQIK